MMRFHHLSCQLLCLSLLAGSLTARAEQTPTASEGEKAEAPASPRAPLNERSELDARTLERQLETAEQQRLQAGETPFLALWRPANAPAAKGLVILLPGDDENADGAQAVGPLRRKLPDAEWHSLSLTLPDPLGAQLPIRIAEAQAPADQSKEQPPASEPAPAESQPESASSPAATADELREAHVQRIFSRIDAGLAFAAQQQTKTLVLLGHGSGGYWAARYMAQRTPANVTHLLLVDARQPEGFTSTISELQPQIKARIGDFYYPGNPATRQDALQRKQFSQRQQQPHYQQVALDALPGNPAVANEQLFRRLRGWLDKQAGEAGSTP